MMTLYIMTPLATERIEGVEAIRAEGLEGDFGILPRHADWASSLNPSILSYRVKDKEHFVGINGGALTKVADEVKIATKAKIRGTSLEELGRRIKTEFAESQEREKKLRARSVFVETSLARLIHEIRGTGPSGIDI